MFEKMIKDGDSKISRRDILKGAGIATIGAAIATTGGLIVPSKASAKGTKFDVEKAGKVAYENYGKVFCTETVVTGLTAAGKIKGVDPSDYFWGHGGMVGWGTACGTLIGAGIIAGMVVDDKKLAQMVLNDVMAYYAYTTLPVYKPQKALIAEIKASTRAETPLCHVSVGRWMKEEGVEFFTDARKERCGRLAADIAMRTATLLNQVAEGTYTPVQAVNAKTYQITAQENCTDCHDGVPFIVKK